MMIKPKRLKKGDKVAIVSLSSGILGESFAKFQKELGIKRLKELGLEAVFMAHALKGLKYVKEHPEKRAQDLIQAFEDESIKGIICVIGGVDAALMTPFLLNEEFKHLVQAKPKLFVGYSDTTNNHLLFYKLGMTSIYGPNFLTDLAELDEGMLSYTKKSFESFFVNSKQFEIVSSPYWYEEREVFDKTQLNTSRIKHLETHGYEFYNMNVPVEGTLLGGCIESLSDYIRPRFLENVQEIESRASIFPSEEEWKDKVVFLESSESFTDLLVMKQMLAYLDSVSIFKYAKAIIVGKPQNENFYDELKAMFVEISNKYHVPLVYNVNFGHAYPKTVIPYGLKVGLDPNNKSITILESFFSD